MTQETHTGKAPKTEIGLGKGVLQHLGFYYVFHSLLKDNKKAAGREEMRQHFLRGSEAPFPPLTRALWPRFC